MASSSLVNERKHLKKMESRSYFWWLDNHIGPKSSKWLAENLDEMDRNVKLMLELIEDDGDSFAKKVEMYYQKRPKLVSYVEEFYRMYRSLAERYDHLTGELRKNVLPGLQNQALASSDMGSEATPAWISPDSNTIRRQSGHRAAGFDFFLGSGKGNPNRHSKGDETSSLSDWETESEVSSIHSYLGIPRNVTEEGLHGKMVESEFRLHDEKEKLQIQEGSGHDSLSMTRSKNLDDLNSKLLDYEEELKIAKEKICLSEEEIVDLKAKLQNLSSLEDNSQHSLPLAENSLNRETMMQIEQLRADVAEQTNQLQTLREEFEALKLRHDRLSSEKDELTTNILKLTGEVDIKNDQIKQLEKQVEGEQEIVGELKIQVLELKILINEGAEEKREAIRQLCFSLEHYRNGYQQLRQAFTGHQQLLIFAS